MAYCFVKGCNNSSRKKSPDVSFHSFSKQLTPEWLSVIGRDPNLFITHQKICSDHFKEEDLVLNVRQNRIWKTVKSDVMPTRNLPEQLPGQKVLVRETFLQEPELPTSSVIESPAYSSENNVLDSYELEEAKIEITEREVESDSSSLMETNINSTSTAVHNYRFDPQNYLKQIRKAQQEGDYFMQKYQNALKTNNRRRRKIVILKRALHNLKKKYPTLD